jgi:hypothetical protein
MCCCVCSNLVTRFLIKTNWQNFVVVSDMTKTMLELLDEHSYIDRLPSPQSFPVGLESSHTDIRSVRTCMATAALLR